MQAASIHVNRLNASYQLPRSRAGSPITIQRRLDRIASELLVRHLENEYSLTGLSSGGFYFIEDLELDLTLDLRDNDDNLARSWSRALNQAIYRKVLSGQDGLIAFRDRATFLTGLIEHLLKGAPWNWYYEEFADLRSLSTGQAVLRLLTEDPDQGRDILRELANRNELNLLLVSLTDAEAEHLISVCLLPDSPSFIPAGAYQRWTAALRELFKDIRLQSKLAPDVARVYLALLQTKPELGPDVNLARFIKDVLDLRHVIAGLADDPRIFSLIGSEDVGGCLTLLGAGESTALLQNLIRTCGGHDTADLLRAIDNSTEPVDQFVTDFGGIFLLAPAILDLGADDVVGANCPYPQPQFGSLSAWLIFITARQCLGPDASQEANDKVLTALAGLSRAPSRESIAEYAATLTSVMHHQFARAVASIARPSEHVADPWFTLGNDSKSNRSLSGLDSALARLSCAVLYQFASKLGAFSDSSPAYLYRNFLAARARVEITMDRIQVHFLSCPLQMVLRMAGFDNNIWRVSWLENKTLAFTFD
jgi:hypothetical protein